MAKYVIAPIVLIILIVAGYVLWNRAQPQVTPTPPNPEPEQQLPVTHTYATSTFSMVYPDGYTVDENYAYEGVPKKPIHGVKFIIPGTMATGTNLSTDSGVAVESLPRALKCTGDIYMFQNVKAQDVTIGNRVWSMASSSDAGAGNLYEEQVYALKDSKPCIAVRYFIHSTNIGNYPPGMVTEFNRTALLTDFDKIRDSFSLAGETPVATTTQIVQ